MGSYQKNEKKSKEQIEHEWRRKIKGRFDNYSKKKHYSVNAGQPVQKDDAETCENWGWILNYLNCL